MKGKIAAIIGIVVAVIAIIVVWLKKKPPVIPTTCSINADCPSGYICKDGICVAIITPPPPTEPASLEGYLKAEDTGNPLPFRTVQLEDTELLSDYTNASGHFEFKNLVTGSYTLVAPSGEGYADKVIAVTLKAGSNRQDITLKRVTAPIPVELSLLNILPKTLTLGSEVCILFNLKFLVVTQECVVETVEITKPGGSKVAHSINCCQSQTYNYWFKPELAGTYQVKVGNLSGSFTVAAISENKFTFDEMSPLYDIHQYLDTALAQSVPGSPRAAEYQLLKEVECYVNSFDLKASKFDVSDSAKPKGNYSLSLGGIFLADVKETAQLIFEVKCLKPSVYGSREVKPGQWHQFDCGVLKIFTYPDPGIYTNLWYLYYTDIFGIYTSLEAPNSPLWIRKSGSFSIVQSGVFAAGYAGQFPSIERGLNYEVMLEATVGLPDGGGGYYPYPLKVWHVGTLKVEC